MHPHNRTLTIITAALLLLALAVAPAAAFSGAGSGTANDPYIITTEAELYSINDIGTTSTYFELGNDISISTYQFPSSNAIINGAKFKEINGAGFTIDFSNAGIYTASSNYAYFTLNIPVDSVIQNLKLKSFKINYGFAAWGSQIFQNTRGTLSNIIIEDCTVNTGLASCVANSGSDVSSGNINNMIVISSTFNANYRGTSNNGGYIYSGIFTNGELKQGTYTANSIPLSVSNSISISSSVQPQTTGNYNHAVVIGNGYTGGSGFTHTNNYNYNTRVSGNLISSNDANGVNGKTTTDISESWFKSTFTAWDWENVWQWNDETNLPELRNANNQPVSPTITFITATPATGGQLTAYTLSATATTEAAGGISSYQWSYSTNAGTTWQTISGATTATYQWTPGNSIAGDVFFKVLVTGADGGTADSWEEGFTTVKVTITTAPAISSVSVSRPLQKVNSPTTLTAIFADNQQATYQWYYQVAGGSWQAITGATEPTATWTPMVTGTLAVKIIATNQYSESSELQTSVTVLPTYTPVTIQETAVDISVPADNTYQAQKQWTLTTDLYALEYFTPNLAYLAHGNAFYYLDSAEQEIIHATNTTGNTIAAAYLGQNTGIITDTSGNTAVYVFAGNSWQYVEQNSASIIASTTQYAATISGGTLRLYNTNGNLIDSTTTTLQNLAGNDNADTFAGYSGKTITYYWVSDGQIQQATQTLTQTITDLHQIPGTDNYIISTDSNTITISISNTGVYTLLATSNTEDPLIHTQATNINVVIGVNAPNEIFIIGADGETDGTYVTGATLNDASIAKATGLYAMAGGEDRQAYILAKSTSSTWQLMQVVSFGDVVDYSQISTTGTFAAVATGLKLYLLEASDVETGTYMLHGVIISSTGSPYAGKLITINGDSIRTDSTGKFLYPVKPNTVYTIIADSTTTEYTATNAALQQLAIRLKPNPFAQSVSYSTDYNSETRNFEMIYTDTRDLTDSVTWVIRETGTQTVVSTQTVPAGQTAYWEVPLDKTFTSYQISMIADRQGTNVENTWMITPDGKNPIDIPGLDESGKTIIFGCVLLIFGGLFGVMHSTKGAILTVAAAGVMTYLGLLNIPWAIIIVAGTLAILAALGRGGAS